eukprot:15072691-Alexandrium_andersonii.AAC.1
MLVAELRGSIENRSVRGTHCVQSPFRALSDSSRPAFKCPLLLRLRQGGLAGVPLVPHKLRGKVLQG